MIHAVIHHALNHALKLGLVIRNVSDLVTLPKVQRKEMKTLDDYQVRQLIQAAESTQIAVLFWVAVSTGLRQHFITTYYGSGCYSWDYWFVGMEEGGGNDLVQVTNRINTWKNLGEPVWRLTCGSSRNCLKNSFVH